MSTFRAIIFDLDGTLIHSAPDLHAAANVALATEGRATLDLETITSFIGDGVETLIDRCLAATGEATEEARNSAFSRFLSAYQDDMTTLTRTYPGVDHCLKHLRAAGIPLAICTNKPTGPATGICAELHLSHYFHIISGAENGQPKKPDPRPLLNVVKRLKLDPSDVLYIGDSHVDYQTARNAGMSFRLFNGGYLKHPLDALRPTETFDHWTNTGLVLTGSGNVTLS